MPRYQFVSFPDALWNPHFTSKQNILIRKPHMEDDEKGTKWLEITKIKLHQEKSQIAVYNWTKNTVSPVLDILRIWTCNISI